MNAASGESARAARRPWSVYAVPLAAALISNLDVALLLIATPDTVLGRMGIGVWATIPLSVLAAGWTYWLFVKLHRQVQMRTQAESAMREVAAQRARTMLDLEQSLRREVTLRRELDHRVRNNLAGLIGLVGLYEESGRTAAQLADAIRGKIGALREVYRLINSTGLERIELHELITNVIAGLAPVIEPGMVSVEGPPTALSSGEASAIAMITQELITNSIKHGALRSGAEPDARIRVSWDLRTQGEFTLLSLSWRESPVRAEAAPPEPGGGVGLPLVEGFAQTDLRGEIRFTNSDGEWRVDLLARLKSAPAAAIGSPVEILQ